MMIEDESVMIVSEARRSCFQLLRLLRSIRSDACDAMALRNVRACASCFDTETDDVNVVFRRCYSRS